MMVDIDGVLQTIGEFGYFQRKVYFAMCIPIMFVGAANLAYVFIAGKPNYRCIVPGCDNTTDLIYNSSFTKFTIPHHNGTLDSCHRFVRKKHHSEACIKHDFNQHLNETCLEGKVFDYSIFGTTVVSEFNLTCKDSWKANAAQAVYFGGIMTGAFVFGFLSDWIGRKKTLMIGFIGSALSGIAIGLVPSLLSFQIMRFLNGMMTSGVFQTAFILGLEFVGPSKRVMCGVIGEYFFALGEIMLGFIAWSTTDWRMLQLLISTPMSIFMFLWWVCPESPRWLQVQGKYEKVVHVLENVAKGNGKQIPLHMLRCQHDADDSSDMNNLKRNHHVTLLNVLASLRMVFRLLSMIFIWIVTTLVYYGLTMNSTDLGTEDSPSKPYIDFILSAIAEFPGYTLAWIGMCYWGRKSTLCFSLIFAGAACAGSGVFPGSNLASVLVPSLLGKCGITCAFAIIYVYTAELFPTSVRNTIIGLCSMFARIGGMLAPFSTVLSSVYVPLPMLVFGVLSLIGGILTLFLPETLKTTLPDTLLEAIMLGRENEQNETGPRLDEEHQSLLEESDDNDEVIQ